jgi:phytanoyl-CoA hydroxylase
MDRASTDTSLFYEAYSGAKLQYDEQGYCIVDGLYSQEQLSEIEAFFEEYKKNGNAVFEGGNRFEEIDPKERQLRAMHPHRYSRKVIEWAIEPAVAEILALLLDRPPLCAQTMYYYKPPGAKGQGMHQDNFYLVSSPATCIAAWTPIDDTDVENGCLYVAPGSHRESIFCPQGEQQSEYWMSYGDSHISPFPRQYKPIPVPVRRGQTLFFSGQLIHGSGPNRTKDRFRRTFIGHYIDEASEHVSQFYHPILNMSGEVVNSVGKYDGGGPCGDGFVGGIH